MSEPIHDWILIVPAHEMNDVFLPKGKVRTVVAGQNKFCLGRLEDGYYAIRDYCPHAGGSLGKGRCDKEGNVICPIHDIKFNLRTGTNTTGEGYRMQTFPLKQDEEGLHIGLEKKKWFSFW